jgi:hypothetical protein
MTPVRLDHVSYACGPEGLGEVSKRFAAELGADVRRGGVHPSFGTTNALVSLTGDMYLEMVAVLRHPAADKAPFGKAVKLRSEAGGGWLGWVVAVDDIAPIERRLGRPAVDGHRQRPDGFDLRWKQIGVDSMLQRPELPFFIQWESEEQEHPGASSATTLTLRRLEMCGDRRGLERWVGEPLADVLNGVEIDWVDGPAGIVAVHVATPSGTVRL